MPTWTNSLEALVGRDHPERGVLGADELAGGLDDPTEHDGKREVADDQLVGAQQPPEPPLGGDHLLGAVDQLAEELVQLETRTPVARGIGGAAGGHVCTVDRRLDITW